MPGHWLDDLGFDSWQGQMFFFAATFRLALEIT
jgi:hypothetical protein